MNMPAAYINGALVLDSLDEKHAMRPAAAIMDSGTSLYDPVFTLPSQSLV